MKVHPDRDKIIEDLIDDIPWKQISYKYGISQTTLTEYVKRFIKVRKERKFNPGDGQLTFWNKWR